MHVQRNLIAAAAGLCVLSSTPAMGAAPIEELQQSVVSAVGSSALSPSVQAFVNEKLLTVVNNPVFIAELKKQNAMGRSLDEIKSIDTQWSNAEEELPIMIELMSNPAAGEITKVFKPMAQVGEVFLMDNQGANAALNALTSDFWQGDEAKWKNSFNKGQGGIDVGEAKLDKSTNEVLQQISLPIADKDGTVLGAICIGLRISAF